MLTAYCLMVPRHTAAACGSGSVVSPADAARGAPLSAPFGWRSALPMPKDDPSSIMGRSGPTYCEHAQDRSAVSDIEKSQDSGERGDSADGALGAYGRLKHDMKQALQSKKDTAVTRTAGWTHGWVCTDPPPTRRLAGTVFNLNSSEYSSAFWIYTLRPPVTMSAAIPFFTLVSRQSSPGPMARWREGAYILE